MAALFPIVDREFKFAVLSRVHPTCQTSLPGESSNFHRVPALKSRAVSWPSFLAPAWGLFKFRTTPHGFRRGLHSVAASRLGRFMPTSMPPLTPCPFWRRGGFGFQ